MSELQVRHIATKLKDLYTGKIDVSDCLLTKNEQTNEINREALFNTRSFAAYALQILASINEDEAAKSITDGVGDQGIDAIYYDKVYKVLWIVQSKWKKKGEGEPETGDTLKFCAGIKKLIEGDFESFNIKVKSKQEEIEGALNDYSVKLKIVYAFTGSDAISESNNKAIEDLLKGINEDEELATFELFTLSKAHKSLAGLVDGQPIVEEMVIEHFSKIDSPYKAIYGYVNGSCLAQLWGKYKSRLFCENIRGFLGDSTVNEGIVQTIIESPDRFFYYNNGITILCNDFKKKPLVQTNAGTFEISSLNIVNGAQTVGAIGRAYEKNAESVGQINVFVKIISLDGCPNNFGVELTKSSNTQNKIVKRDFVSLDPEHERLKTELSILGVCYHIKRSSDDETSSSSCSVDELMVSVACSLDDIDLAVTSKREVGLLWDNIDATPYKKIIHPQLSAIKAWRCVQVMRKISEYINQNAKQTTGRERMCLVHSNRFVLHLLLNKISSFIDEESNDFDKYLSDAITTDIISLEKSVYDSVEKKYKKSLVHQVFRNYTKCRDLKTYINK